MKKQGFISMTLVYTFLIVFLFLMLAILNSYLDKDRYLETINDQIDDDISKTNKTINTLMSVILKNNTPISLEEENNLDKIRIYLFDISNQYNDNEQEYNKLVEEIMKKAAKEGWTQAKIDEEIKKIEERYYTSASGSGLYYTSNPIRTDENDDGTTGRIYFFRGDIESNHLVYANKCWRIIRTNEDGSIRISYNGPFNGSSCPTRKQTVASVSSSAEGKSVASIARLQFNKSSNNKNNVKYVYSIDGSEVGEADADNLQTELKETLENWYLNEIKNKYYEVKNGSGEVIESISYDAGVADSIFCNDTTICTGNQICVNREKINEDDPDEIITYSSTNIIPRFKNDDVELNYDKYKKKNITNTVTYKCNKNDAYSTFTGVIGNKLLFYPIGTLTANDIAFAGAYMTNERDKYEGGNLGMKNEKFFLYTGEDYWTISPYAFENNTAKMVYLEKGTGILKKTPTDSVHSVIPVISIKPDNLITLGNGSHKNPYIVRLPINQEEE